MKNIEDVEPHLGGHEGMTNTDEGALAFLISELGIKSMVDVGCGPGGQVEIGLKLGLNVVGIDGDYLVRRNRTVKDHIIIHDFSKGELIPPKTFDLGWTVEFVEHVDEEYVSNFMRTLQACKYVLMTHAFPAQEGHHHVNLRDQWYWIDIFSAFGFKADEEMTNKVRNSSTMHLNFVRQQCIFFRNLHNPEEHTTTNLKQKLVG